MGLYLGVHKLPAGMKEQEVVEGFGKYKKSANEKGISALSAVYSLEKGFAYCQTEAHSAQEVKDAHAAASIPLEDVIEIKQI